MTTLIPQFLHATRCNNCYGIPTCWNAFNYYSVLHAKLHATIAHETTA